MTVRIGVIGTGMIGRDHTRRIQQVLAGAEVVALSDYNPDAARAVQADLARLQLAHWQIGEVVTAAGGERVRIG